VKLAHQVGLYWLSGIPLWGIIGGLVL